MYGWQLDRSGAQPVLKPVSAGVQLFNPTRRRVIILPGWGLHDGANKRPLAGTIKYTEHTIARSLDAWAKGTSDPIDVFLYTYSEPYGPYHSLSKHYKNSPDVSTLTQDGKEFCRHYLRSLLLSGGENFSDLTAETMKERLCHLTVIGHSYGSIVAQDIVKYLTHELQLAHGPTTKSPWSDEVIQDVVKELVIISVASISRTDYPGVSATQFFFTAPNDATAIHQISTYAKDANAGLHAQCGYPSVAAAPIHYATKLEKKPKLQILRHGFLVSTPMPDQCQWLETRRDGTRVMQHLSEADIERTQTMVEHDYRTFLYGHPMMGKLLVDVANNAVQREVGIGDGHQLFASTQRSPKGDALLGQREGNTADRAGRL